ncbi:stage III sporulation protein AF [Sporolactobacillus sp. CQH2019]|uniref:stage III sporulation protein AF n=1 Tax=Sporolactobacillus sp. CQH2019 TaxID=3023512 RepID=UPI0023677070|nr:stage III sporulation protein AF [Sporolactobacillus sp. CQH2019]MDD9149295.1 stage III sporulation protein AF [Sporolactobacillus sp. CQH2019]
MNYLGEWVSQLVVIVLFAVILELLLPARSFQRYVKFVIGLVLIVALMDPIIRLFQLDPVDLIRGLKAGQGNVQIQNETDGQKKEIESAQTAYIQEQVAVQMKDLVKEELNRRYGVSIKDLTLSMKQGGKQDLLLQSAAVVLEKTGTQGQSSDASDRTVRPVKEVSIRVGQGTPDQGSAKRNAQIEKIRSFLAGRWEIDKNLITLHMEGGSSVP